MSILPVCEADLPAILALQKTAFADEARLVGDWNIPPLTQTLSELAEDLRKGVMLKALSDRNELVGTVRAQASGLSMHIGRLAVLPQWRGRGYGSALLQAIMAVTTASRYELFTSAQSERNLRLYQSFGFRPFKTTQTATGVELIWLEKTATSNDVECGNFKAE